jgi:hypothetical protein
MVIGRKFLSLLLILYCVAGKTSFCAQPSYIISDEMPQLEEEEPSVEEQKMLDIFSAQEPTLFWQWVYRIGGIVVTRYIMVKEVIKKKYGDFKEWLNKNKKNNRKAFIKK